MLKEVVGGKWIVSFEIARIRYIKAGQDRGHAFAELYALYGDGTNAMSLPTPICPQQTPCKCCGAVANIFGVVDFNKNCESHRRSVLPFSGIPIYYHRCTRCRLIFTVAFDHFSNQDFLDHIYNESYALVDPDYAESRPRNSADAVTLMLGGHKQISILDYGGGNGNLAIALRASGFTDVDTYDPFVPEHATHPDRRYDCILCFEVVEHTPQPADTFRDIDSLLKPDGLVIFSTLVQPSDIETLGVSWWYVAPRNGHVSLYTQSALAAVLRPLGLRLGAFTAGLHVAWREVPDFARHLIKL
jgi:2-polyprenyl-6-hydroxyphenyl methylase/3-demethylubiquinone-9 3-methyltransferase